MVRNRKRKTNNADFNEDTMREAVQMVLDGKSLRSAAKMKGISYSTLLR